MMSDTPIQPVILPTPHQQVFSLILALGLLGFILTLVRKRTIREEYAILWLMTGIGIVVLSVSEPLLTLLVRISGVGMASSILFLTGILFLVLINIHLSAIISRHRTMIKGLSIRVAILEAKLQETNSRSEVAMHESAPFAEKS